MSPMSWYWGSHETTGTSLVRAPIASTLMSWMTRSWWPVVMIEGDQTAVKSTSSREGGAGHQHVQLTCEIMLRCVTCSAYRASSGHGDAISASEPRSSMGG